MLHSYFKLRNWGIEREEREGKGGGEGRGLVGEAVLVMQKFLEVLHGCLNPEIFLDIWKTTGFGCGGCVCVCWFLCGWWCIIVLQYFFLIYLSKALELDFLIYKEIRQIRKICLSNVLEMQVNRKGRKG